MHISLALCHHKQSCKTTYARRFNDCTKYGSRTMEEDGDLGVSDMTQKYTLNVKSP